ncbi:MAG: FAD-dependent oxidoreductase [Pseudomonadota bacterium]
MTRFRQDSAEHVSPPAPASPGAPGRSVRRPLVFAAAALAILLAALLLGGESGDIAALRSWTGRIAAWHRAHPLLLAGLYFAVYVAVAALSLPFAVWMTLGAGALFGLALGTALVAVAATLGATLAFLASRFLLRDWVLARFGHHLARTEDGFRRDGAFYLFTLRLIPAVPFFLVNLLMGLTSLPARTFAWVSFAGMLPATVLYVNAGTNLAGIGSLRDVLSGGVIVSLLMLGAFPWVARGALGAVRRRRLYARWTRPARFDRNLVVIGGGAAGLVSAYVAAAVRAKVTLVEGGRMGGDCLNHGCVPSKTLIRSARVAHEMRTADRFGAAPVEPAIDFPAVLRRIREVIARIAPNDSPERYRALGVDVVQGHARILDPWTVAITPSDPGAPERRLTTRAIVIAAGARPALPDLPGLESTGYLTSDTLWDRMEERGSVPGRLAILGGGPIGCELAQAFARLGSRVRVVEAADRILPKEDADVAAAVQRGLRRDGVEVLAGHRAVRAGSDGDGGWLDVAGPGGDRRILFDELLVAVGRQARTEGYGLEDLGIPAGRVIETDGFLQTLYPNIYVAGDAAGPFQLTHAGAHQGWHASVNALFGSIRRFRPDYRALPRAIFTDPEVARVGMGEDEARAAGTAVEVTRFDLSRLDRAVADGIGEGFVKVLTPPRGDRILGAVIVGGAAAETVAEFALAMRHGIGLGGVLSTVHAYPTLAEANRLAAGEWRKAHVGARTLALLARYHDWRRG